MRLSNVETGHDEQGAAELAAQLEAVGHLDPIDHLLAYRKDLFGSAFRRATEEALAGGEWSIGDLELFAAFVSAVNQCPF
jgi:hypothetical protein